MPGAATWRQFEAAIVALLTPMVATVAPGDSLPAGKVNSVFSVLNADVAKTKGTAKPFIAVAFEDWTTTKSSVTKFKIREEGFADFVVLVYAASGAEKGEARGVGFDLLDPIRNLLLGARWALESNATGFDGEPTWPIRRHEGQKNEGFLDVDSKAGVVVCYSKFYATGVVHQVA